MMNRHHRPQWRKSTYSGTNGSCVELADRDELIAMRDSKLGDHSPVLTFTRADIEDFLGRCKAGEFDNLT